MNKLDELIKSIPFELKDCFYIKADYELVHEMTDQFAKYTRQCLTFPCVYKGIPIVISEMKFTELDVIPNKKSYFKVSSYEINKAEKFLNEYEKLCSKHNLSISGCGCCGSPYLDDGFYTITIENILYKDGKLSYEIKYSYRAREYLQIDEGEDNDS